MVTPLKPTDLPEPWFPQESPNGKKRVQRRALMDVNAIEHLTMEKMVDEPAKRGRGRLKSAGKVIHATKGKKKVKSLTPSAVDVVLGRSTNLVQDPNELSQKMEEDARACGRSVQTVEKPTPRTSALASSLISSNSEQRREIIPSCNSERSERTPTSPRIEASSVGKKRVVDADIGVPGRVNEDTQAIFGQRPGKEVLPRDEHRRLPRQSFTEVNVRHERMQVPVDSDDNLKDRHVRDMIRRPRCSLSPPMNYSHNRYPGREVCRSESPREGRRSYGERFDQLAYRNPRQNLWTSNGGQESRSPQRSRSRSPEYWREGPHDRRPQKRAHYYEDQHMADHSSCGYEDIVRPFSGDGRHHKQYEPSFADRDSWHRKYDSPEYNSTLRTKNCTPYSWKSPPRMPSIVNPVEGMERQGSTAVKKEAFVGLSPALDRKQRRQRQALCESEQSRRERDGKKPFYLTLDPQGKPYGPGKTAWIARINNLACGLDPSCTNIRKQTFEAIQTLKDRLNDDFEYSGALNEDYLRGLMGKAVTKRRTEFITFIQRKGKQPLTMDEEIWLRLEKLAKSQQRKDKSEQGRYANSCRKTLGRTGSIGVNGVREKLRSILGRSPDPDEVEEEVQRDKGYGGMRKRRSSVFLEVENNSEEGKLLLENCGSEERAMEEDKSLSDADSVEQYELHGRDIAERSQRSNEFGMLEVDSFTRTEIGYNNAFGNGTNEISKDDYIEKLEAEIVRLNARKAKASSSAVRSSISPLSKRY